MKIKFYFWLNSGTFEIDNLFYIIPLKSDYIDINFPAIIIRLMQELRGNKRSDVSVHLSIEENK